MDFIWATEDLRVSGPAEESLRVPMVVFDPRVKESPGTGATGISANLICLQFF